MKALIRHARAGISFLTLIPVASREQSAEDLGKALYTFPMVGLLIGGISFGFAWAAGWLFGSPMHVVFALSVSTIVTLGFHLDGLADSCDALFSWRSRERKLEIMKDSRIGVMGALALILIFLIKGGALVALGNHWWIGVLLAPAWGRWAALYGIQWFPKATDVGLAAQVGANHRRAQFWIASGYLIALTVGLLIWRGPWLGCLILPTSALVGVHLLARAMSKSLGGLTGDTYGALSECAEAIALLALCASIRF